MDSTCPFWCSRPAHAADDSEFYKVHAEANSRRSRVLIIGMMDPRVSVRGLLRNLQTFEYEVRGLTVRHHPTNHLAVMRTGHAREVYLVLPRGMFRYLRPRSEVRFHRREVPWQVNTKADLSRSHGLTAA